MAHKGLVSSHENPQANKETHEWVLMTRRDGQIHWIMDTRPDSKFLGNTRLIMDK